MLQNLSFAAVVIGALRVKKPVPIHIHALSLRAPFHVTSKITSRKDNTEIYNSAGKLHYLFGSWVTNKFAYFFVIYIFFSKQMFSKVSFRNTI